MNEQSEKDKNNDELFNLLGELIGEIEVCEKEIEELTHISKRTKEQEKELKHLKGMLKIMMKTKFKAEDHLIHEYGGPMVFLEAVKQQAALGDKEAQEDLKLIEPVVHQYLLDKTEKN